ncbi:MAG: porin [Flavobacterium sp.]|nr:porin [Pedobacter sp.]
MFNLKRIIILIVMGPSCAYAQDSVRVVTTPKISGFADAYYRYSLLNATEVENTFNNYTSFTNSQNSFELGMLSLKVEHTMGKVAVVGDLGFGKRAEEFSYNDEKTMLAIKQLYLSYSPSENVKFTAGSWATHIGYELVDAPGNRNYSMSYMFSYGPFFHTGLKAEVTSGKSGFMLGIVNPTDFKTANFSKKYLIGQYSVALAEDKVKVYLNGLLGKADVNSRNNQLDLVVTGAVSDKLSLGYNGTVASSQAKDLSDNWLLSKNWWGSAVYFNYDPATVFGMTLRTEYFSDSDAITSPFAGTTGGNVFSATLSGNIRLSNLVLIPEFRVDNATKDIFIKPSGSSGSSPSFLLGAYYKF